jgi:hypothetical protein
VACDASSVLQGRTGHDLHRERPEREPASSREAGDECGLTLGSGAEAMVDVGDGETPASRRRKPGQRIEQCG